MEYSRRWASRGISAWALLGWSLDLIEWYVYPTVCFPITPQLLRDLSRGL